MPRSMVGVLVVFTACSDSVASSRKNFAVELRQQFDQAQIYADGDSNTRLVADIDCERLMSWAGIGGVNNVGFRELKCRQGGDERVYDLRKPLPIAPRSASKAVNKFETGSLRN